MSAERTGVGVRRLALQALVTRLLALIGYRFAAGAMFLGSPFGIKVRRFSRPVMNECHEAIQEFWCWFQTHRAELDVLTDTAAPFWDVALGRLKQLDNHL
jgi:hypothetical protein